MSEILPSVQNLPSVKNLPSSLLWRAQVVFTEHRWVARMLACKSARFQFFYPCFFPAIFSLISDVHNSIKCSRPRLAVIQKYATQERFTQKFLALNPFQAKICHFRPKPKINTTRHTCNLASTRLKYMTATNQKWLPFYSQKLEKGYKFAYVDAKKEAVHCIKYPVPNRSKKRTLLQSKLVKMYAHFQINSQFKNHSLRDCISRGGGRNS